MEKKKDWFAVSMVFVCLATVIVPFVLFLGMLFYDTLLYSISCEMEEFILMFWLISSIALVIFIILSKIKKRWKLFNWGIVSLVIALFFFMLAPALQRAKPVIYLYPEKPQIVRVNIEYKGEFICTYPAMGENGWEVVAYPDGTIKDIETGRKYYCLFWEGRDKLKIDIDSGFIVPGEQTAEFLEEKLQEIGLNEMEANEFIIYWLPKMVGNKYNLIHFATDEYDKLVPLKVDPRPDTIIRVLMLYKAVNRPFDIVPQTFEHKEREGFTLVEWGGTEI